MINSICVVRLSALGDVLMLVPLIRALQTGFPDATITWVISRPAYDLVEGMDRVEFVVIDKPDSLADYWRFNQQFRHRQFDVLLAAQASFRANLLYPLIRARRKVGYDALRAKDGHGWFVKERIRPGNDHTLEGFLKFAEPLGLSVFEEQAAPTEALKVKNLRWDMPLDEISHAWVRRQLNGIGPYLVVNPAASKPERSWPVERYVEVIRHVQATWNLSVVLTGGPGPFDRQLADAIMAEVPSCLDFAGKTKPKQLLALISQARLVLCPDTGPSHMAASVGTPVVALHAVTSSDVSGPYTFRHLAVDCYPQAVEQVLKKTGETNVWGTHAHGEHTMELVTVEAVINKLSEALHRS
ncbi:glycosyltransferase family 9 protein [Legionella sp. CNM-4043-24]|uniref:glycosyltransferase family 9 protein n=1 Tax=Legionella sp. CNM-4043-24 TaxID=3421646 RepID=UPI00403B0D23